MFAEQRKLLLSADVNVSLHLQLPKRKYFDSSSNKSWLQNFGTFFVQAIAVSGKKEN